MTDARWWRRPLAAAFVPVASLGAALLYLTVAPDRDLAGSITAYALAALPLGALVGAGSAGLGGRPRIAGAIAAVLGGLAVAQFSAMVRFYLAGARGFLSLAAAPYTAEVLMLIGSGFSVAWLGARVAGARWDRGWLLAASRAGLVGMAASPLIGAGLIGVKFAGMVPFLNPVMLWLLVVVLAAAWSRRG